MMNPIGTVVSSVLFVAVLMMTACCGPVHGGWISEFVGGRNVDLGNGLEVQLQKINKKNASFLEKHELKFGYGGVGVGFSKAPGEDQLQIGLYQDDDGEKSGKTSGSPRSKKMGEVLVPAALGATMTGSVAIMLASVTVLTLKALALAKLAFVIAIGFLLAKFLSHHHHSESIKEYDFHPGLPVMAEHSGFGTGYAPSASGNYLAYANYVPGQDASLDLSGQYSTNSAQALTDTSNASAGVAAASLAHATGVKRRDIIRPKFMPLISIKKISYSQ